MADCRRVLAVLRSEVFMLQTVQSEMFLELRQLVATRARLRWSATLRGRAANAAGYALAVYGVYRVLNSMANIALKRDPTKDPVTAGFELALAFFSVPDAQLWIQPASFAVVGALVAASVRGFLVSAGQVARALGAAADGGDGGDGGGGGGGGGGDAAVLLLCLVMGQYFIATVLTMRMSMPEEFRRSVSASLGMEIEFSFFHR